MRWSHGVAMIIELAQYTLIVLKLIIFSNVRVITYSRKVINIHNLKKSIRKID